MSRPIRYVLDGKVPRPASSMEWAAWLEAADRKVARTEIGDTVVSTVFMDGLDHAHLGDGPPILFETMVFADGDPLDEIQVRYSTWAEAETGHIEICEQIQALDEQSAQSMTAVLQAIKSKRE